MKKLAILLLAATAMFASCAKETAATDETAPPTKAEAGYAFGVAIGTSIKSTAVEIDYGTFVKGMKDVLEKGEAKLSQEAAEAIINRAIGAALSKVGEANLAAEKAYFEENAKKSGVFTTASGLQYEIVSEGTGPKPLATDLVVVDYVGSLVDGTIFDSSLARGAPLEIQLDQVIPGWTEGVMLMNKGSKYKLYIPSSLAYGEQGAGGVIPPNATIIFDVELMDILPPAAPETTTP